MTSLYLVLWIAGGVLLQVAAYLSLGFWRHWQSYQALRHAALDLNIALDQHVVPEVIKPTVPAWTGLRSFRVENKVIEDAAGQICSLYLAPVDANPLPPFFPGQFLTFALDVPTTVAGSQSVVRCYSLSDAPQPDRYRISVKRVPAPTGGTFPAGVSSNYLHDHVQVGNQLQVRAPTGHFFLDRSAAPVVLIGGGIGITPMLSMVNWCLSAQPGREVWLFYGLRNSAELVMQTQLTGLAAQHPNFHLHLCLSDSQPSDPGKHHTAPVHYHHSRVDIALLRRLLPLKPYHYYLCGPTAMLQSLVPALEDWGVPDGNIHFEAFGPASIPRKNAVSPPQVAASSDSSGEAVLVTFAKSGKQATWEPGKGSLLDFAEDLGIAVSSGCRAGGCGSCQTGIRTGQVAYMQTPDFDPEPGSCLLCVCKPKTAVTLEA